MTEPLPTAFEKVSGQLRSGPPSENRIWITGYDDTWASDARNQLLFFLKPEALADGVAVDEVLSVVGETFARHAVEVGATVIISSRDMKERGTVAAHYGVINAIANRGVEALSPEATTKLDVWLADSDLAVVPAFQLLDEVPDLTAAELGAITDGSDTYKLAGGSYISKVTIRDRDLAVLNGFHPAQIEHYTAPGRAILVLEARTNTSWSTIRNEVVGATNPQAALATSVRGSLRDRAEEFGLGEVGPGTNCIHGSAGPVEGMVEIARFCDVPLESTALGQRLLSSDLLPKDLSWAAGNPAVGSDGVPLFDVTEEWDSERAIELLATLS